tara:strand:- start:10074 stop:11183 length:1110 start_codon:yes stop_codon:yes gene_type:complete
MDARMAPQARKDQAMAVIQEMNEKDKAEKEKDKALAGETKRLMKMAEAFGAPPGQVLAWDKDQLAGYVEGTMKKAVYDRDVSARKLGEKQDLRAEQTAKAQLDASAEAKRSARSRAITADAGLRLKYQESERERKRQDDTDKSLGLAVLESLERKTKANKGKDVGDPGYSPLNTLELLAERFEKDTGSTKGFTVTEEMIEAFGGQKGLNAGQATLGTRNIAEDPGPDRKFGTDDDKGSLGVQSYVTNPDGSISLGGSFRTAQSYGGSAPTGPRQSLSTDNNKWENLRREMLAGDVDRVEYLAGQMFQDDLGDPDLDKVAEWKALTENVKELRATKKRAEAVLADPGSTQQARDLAQASLDEADAQLSNL